MIKLIVILISTTVFGLAAHAAEVASDDSATEAKAAFCERCTHDGQNNDKVTDDSRAKRAELAANLTGENGKPESKKRQDSDTGK